MQLAQKIIATTVPQGKMGIFFLGQAGFILQSPNGERMGIDLYLSNCCERYFGFKRLTPQLLLPGELELDWVLASHAHYDHFDPDSIPLLLANGRTRLLVAGDCAAECARLGISEERFRILTLGERVSAGDFEILPVPCDHGEAAPDALGLYICCGESSFYLTGDTCLRTDYARRMAQLPIRFCAAPINGAYGNMNAEEAAEFFCIVRPEKCMPCHYWNFAQHLGDPNAWIQAMERRAEHPEYVLMAPGEFILA